MPDSKFKTKQTLFVIMSKDRKYIAKGVPRNRELILVSDTNDKKRILTYSSKKKAESGFKHSGFYGQYKLGDYDKLSDVLEAVEMEITMTEIR